MNQRNIFLFLAFYLLFSITIVSCKSNKEDAKGKVSVKSSSLRAEGYIVEPQTFQNDLSASGTLLPNESVEIHPEVTGRITAINFKEGSYVKKGQTLIRLYDADIIAQIQKLKSQKALQQSMERRQKELLDIGGISHQEYETTQTQIASINADIAFQEAQLRKMRVIAPFDGKIGIRAVSPGAIVSPSTVVATLQQLHPLKMDFTVPDQYKSTLTPGKTVFFTVDGYSEPLSGKISAVDPGADIATRSVKVRATVPNPDGKLVAGSFAHVRVPFQSNNNALLIPSQAVIPTTRDKKVAVLRQGKAELVTVQLGPRTEDKVQVTEGIQAGDTVITTGIMQVKPGMEVTITRVQG